MRVLPCVIVASPRAVAHVPHRSVGRALSIIVRCPLFVFNVDASNADSPESVSPVCYITAILSSLQSAFLKNRKNNRVQYRGNNVNAFVFVSYQSPPVNTSVVVARPSIGSVLPRDDTATRPSRRRPAILSPSDERNQTVDRQRHDRIERHAQPVRPPSGANLYVRQA